MLLCFDRFGTNSIASVGLELIKGKEVKQVLGYEFENIGNSNLSFRIEGYHQEKKTDTITMLKEVKGWIEAEIIRLEGPSQVAMAIAAQAWCKESTKCLVMIPELVRKFAKILDAAWNKLDQQMREELKATFEKLD